jgi:hypothetical protein
MTLAWLCKVKQFLQLSRVEVATTQMAPLVAVLSLKCAEILAKCLL